MVITALLHGDTLAAALRDALLASGASTVVVTAAHSYSSAPETATVRSQTRTVEAPSRSRLEIIAPVSRRDAVLAVLHSSDRVAHAFSQEVHYDS